MVFTDSLKYKFDLQGFLVLPSILNSSTCEKILNHLETFRSNPDTLERHLRSPLSGPCEELIRHPVLMEILTQIIGPVDKIRCENAFYEIRENHSKRWDPHAGGVTLNPNYYYHCHNGQIYSGMTRVIWELAPVQKNSGGTAFIPGSHKAHFMPTPDIDAKDSGVWDSYECPEGSLILFSEAVRHTATDWKQETPRQAIFCAYNHICVRHHKPSLSQVQETQIKAMKPENQRFFNEVYHPQFDRS